MITFGFEKLNKFGYIGANLFSYTGTRLYAKSNNFHYAFPKWIGNYIFENIKPYNLSEYLKSIFLPTVQLDDIKSYSKIDKIKYLLGLSDKLVKTINIEELYKKPRDNINLYGYMQDDFSLNLISENKEKILAWFIFKKYIDEAYNKLTHKFQPWIGLHIRRTDFIKRNMSLPPEFFITTLEKIRNGRNLYIASDDKNITAELNYLKPLIVKNNLPDMPDYVFDFWMLKNAQTVIGCGSTFSWWAAYLGNKNDYYSPPLTHLWKNYSKIQIEKQNI